MPDRDPSRWHSLSLILASRPALPHSTAPPQVKGVADAGAASLRVSGLELGGLFGSLLAGGLRARGCLRLLEALLPGRPPCGPARRGTLNPDTHTNTFHPPLAGKLSDMLINNARGTGAGFVGKRIQARGCCCCFGLCAVCWTAPELACCGWAGARLRRPCPRARAPAVQQHRPATL